MRRGRVAISRNLPPGRKQRSWKKDFLASLAEAARDMGEVSENEIVKTVRAYRRKSRRRAAS
jgi:hypothetical protein